MAAELLAQRQWVTQQTDFMQESLQQHLHTRAALENARHIPCNMACNYYHESKLSIAALCTVYTLRLANVLQTYGPISGCGCLLDEPTGQWEGPAFMYIRHAFADLNVRSMLCMFYLGLSSRIRANPGKSFFSAQPSNQ